MIYTVVNNRIGTNMALTGFGAILGGPIFRVLPPR